MSNTTKKNMKVSTATVPILLYGFSLATSCWAVSGPGTGGNERLIVNERNRY